ncbi:MAG: hypothetical protein P8X47_07800 [Ignavibacteriaceae bacterium]
MIRQTNKIYTETKEDWANKYLTTYLILMRNAAGKKDEARKLIKQGDDNIDEAMRIYRKYDRIMDYLFDRINRERSWREFGSA